MGNILPAADQIINFPIQAARFRELREREHFSQKAICDLIDRDLKTYRKWEKGFERPDCEVLIELSKMYDVSTDYLLGLTELKKLDLDFICEYTGLSDQAISALHNMNQPWHDSDWFNPLDYFISVCGDEFSFLLSEIKQDRTDLAAALENRDKADSEAERLRNKRKLESSIYKYLSFCYDLPEKLFSAKSLLNTAKK